MAAYAGVLFVFAAFVASGSLLDDPFIFSRYADNFLQNGDLLWNLGEPRVEGFSSWAWLGIHALGLKLGFHPVGFSRVVGTLFGATYAALFVAALRRRVGAWMAAAFGILGALAPDLWFYAASGMDVILWTLASWIWLGWFARSVRLTVGHVAAAGALLLVRPEAMLLLGICALRAMLEIRAGKNPVRGTIRALLVGSAVPAVLLGVRFALFGQWVANSVAAKHLGGSPILRMLSGLEYVAAVGQVFLLPSVAMVAVALAAGKGVGNAADVLESASSRLVSACGAFVVLTIAMVVAAGGDDTSAFPFARLFVPVLGPLAYCLAVGVETVVVDARRRRMASGVLLCLFLVTFLPRAKAALKLSAEATNMSTVGGMLASIREREAPGPSAASTYLVRETPQGEVVALPWAGRIPYETRLTTIDLLGLNDRHIASLPTPQRGIDVKYDPDYVLRRRPYFICESIALRAAPADIAKMNADELFAGGAWKLGQRKLVQDPRFTTGYELDPVGSELTGGTCFRRRA